MRLESVAEWDKVLRLICGSNKLQRLYLTMCFVRASERASERASRPGALNPFPLTCPPACGVWPLTAVVYHRPLWRSRGRELQRASV